MRSMEVEEHIEFAEEEDDSEEDREEEKDNMDNRTVMMRPTSFCAPSLGNISVRYNDYGLEFDKAVIKNENIVYRERMAREHDARQSFIEDEVISIIKASPMTSYRDVATKINGWCSPAP
jgi:hypothetical protein